MCKPPEFPRGAAKLISTDFSDMGGDGKTIGSPSSFIIFSNGWNWDKLHGLKFIPDTHTKGLTLLQSLHFVVAPRKLHYLSNFQGNCGSCTRLAASQSCEACPTRQAGTLGVPPPSTQASCLWFSTLTEVVLCV